jgi:hypothetical protein
MDLLLVNLSNVKMLQDRDPSLMSLLKWFLIDTQVNSKYVLPQTMMHLLNAF